MVQQLFLPETKPPSPSPFQCATEREKVQMLPNFSYFPQCLFPEKTGGTLKTPNIIKNTSVLSQKLYLIGFSEFSMWPTPSKNTGYLKNTYCSMTHREVHIEKGHMVAEKIT